MLSGLRDLSGKTVNRVKKTFTLAAETGLVIALFDSSGAGLQGANLEIKIAHLCESTAIFVAFQDRRPTLHQIQP